MFQLCNRAPPASVAFQTKGYSPRAARSLFIKANSCWVNWISSAVICGGAPQGAEPVPLVSVGPEWVVDVDVFGFAAGVLSCRGITIAGEGVGCCAILKLSLVSGCAGTPCLLCPAAHAVSSGTKQRHRSSQNFPFRRNETSLSALICDMKTLFAIMIL